MLKKQIRKYNLIQKHMELVRSGKYEAARLVLYFLRAKTIHLGLDDASSTVEIILEDLGFKPSYSRNYCSARFHM